MTIDVHTSTCPECGRDFKVWPLGDELLLVLPITPQTDEDCPECAKVLQR